MAIHSWMSRVSSLSGGFELRMRARISSLAELASGIGFPLALTPPLPEALFRDRTQVARRTPSRQHSRQFSDHIFVHKRPLRNASHALCCFQSSRIGKDISHGLHAQVFWIELSA